MRPWRRGRRPGFGVAVLSARPRHSGKPGAGPVVASLFGRRGDGNREHGPTRIGTHRTSHSAEGNRMTAPFKTNMGKIAPSFDAEKARADFEILSRQVYGKPLAYLDSGASAQKPRVVLDA